MTTPSSSYESENCYMDQVVVDIVRTRDRESVPLVLAGSQSGLYWSRDDGDTWQGVNTLTSTPITSVATQYDHRSGTQSFFAAGIGFIARTSILSDAWERTSLAVPTPAISAMTCFPGELAPGVALACTLEDGVLRTTDNGASWEFSNVGLIDMNVLSVSAVTIAGGEILTVIGTGTGVFTSENLGRSWLDRSKLDDKFAAVTAVSAVCSDAGPVLLAGTERGEIYQSRDRGFTWELQAHYPQLGEVVAFLNPDNAKVRERFLAVYNSGVVASMNTGALWQPIWQPATDHTPPQFISATLITSSEDEHHLLASLAGSGVSHLVVRTTDVSEHAAPLQQQSSLVSRGALPR